jgi:hypothetical protein
LLELSSHLAEWCPVAPATLATVVVILQQLTTA